MPAFRQNDELTLAPEALVKENVFLTKTPDTDALPTFEASKNKLPIPLWDGHEAFIDCYWKTWQLAFGNLRNPLPGTGFVSSFIDTAFNGCLFMWDSSFILMFGKYADRIFNFQKTLDNFYSHQHKDGFICREIDEATGTDRFTRYDPSATGPDIMAWCEWEYFLNFGDKDRLSKVFPPLMAYHRWMAANHTWPDGTYFSSGWGCGMDNSPRLMPGTSVSFSHGHMIWVDACLQALLSCNILIEMAALLGRTEFIEELKTERNHLNAVINEKLWDDKTGFYYDLWKNGEHNMVRHVGAFWALIAQCVSKDRAKRLIAHLEDERGFKTPHRVPTLACDHPAYDKRGNYWCGSVWSPTNYMVLKGLDKYGEYSLSHQIALEHLDAVVRVFQEHGTVFENYAPEFINDARPAKGNIARPDFVGWTGLSPISILFEHVFGIKPNAAEHKIVWDVNLTERHGIEKYPFGTDGELTLMCETRGDQNEKPQITLLSNVPVELEVIWGTEKNKHTFLISRTSSSK
ncbi:MAG: hypothetical protein IJ390_03020 [Lachnospiraceae bacterium]|nr:hypothetical protein [Lachnospiraceae bacterium]